MADLKISQLNSLAGASLANNDVVAVVDTSASETKKITSVDLIQYGYGLLSASTLDGDIIEAGTTSARGTLQLTDSTSSTSTTTAATPNSVKSAYDLGNAALPKAGGTMTGAILADDSTSPSTPGYAFDGDPDTGLLRTGANELAVVTGGSARITVDGSGNVVIPGNFTVQGTTTTIDTTTLVVKDKNIEMGAVATPTDVTADGGGITLKGTTDKTINWIDATDAWTSSERFSYPLGSAAAPTLTFTGDPDTGVYSPGANQVAISTGGSGRLFVDANGTVLLAGGAVPGAGNSNPFLYRIGGGGLGLGAATETGTVAPILFYTAATERLRITSAGLVGIGTSSPNNQLEIASAVGGIIRLTDTDGGYSLLEGGAGDLALQADAGNTQANSKIQFFVDNTEKARLDSSGRLGIGTQSPGTKLHLEESSTDCRLRIISGTAFDAAIQLGDTASFSQGAIIYDNATDALRFQANGFERARIDSSGRLLVGTSSTSQSATALLQGNSSIGATGAGILKLSRGEATPANGINIGEIRFTDSGHTSAATLECVRDGGTWTSGTSQPTRLTFSTTADGAASPTERMRISSSGGIAFGGQGAPYVAATCDSYNNTNGYFAHAFRQDHASGYGIGIGIDGEYLAYFYSNKDLTGAPVGSISQNGSATAYNTSSDYRLKENVVPVTDGIARLQQLKPSRFNFIADPDKTVDGFLAHEVQDIVPEAITGDKDAVDDEGNPKYQGIDQSKLVPLLTAALQEAIAKIETLEARLNALESA